MLYTNWQDLNMTIAYDLQQEKLFDYTELNINQAIEHLAHFVSGLWQIHPFSEGNTRTTAIFTIKYLRSIGFTDINNDLFEQHSWYFRNALVRSNYKNLRIGVNADFSFLIAFFRNLLLSEQTPLHNREMHIDWKKQIDTESAKKNIQSANTSVSKCKDCTLEELAVLKIIEKKATATQKEIAVQIGKSERTIKTLTKRLSDRGFIRRENGKRNGYWSILSNQPTKL